MVTIDIALFRDGSLDPSQVKLLSRLRPAIQELTAKHKIRSPIPPGNLAYRKPAKLLSLDGTRTLPPNGGGGRLHLARCGVDGDPATDAQASAEWPWTYEVDLTEPAAMRRIVITFGKNFATRFQVQLSLDHSAWTTVAEVKDHDGAKWENSFPPVSARYVRVRALKPDGDHQKGGQMSVAELEVYATEGAFSAANALQRLGALKAGLPALKADLQAVKLRGQDPSYPAIAATVLEDFIGYAEEDARRGEVRRSLEQVGDLERMAARLRGEVKEALAGLRQFPAVPRWTGDQRPVIRGSSFLAPVRLPGGTPQERPVFFTGYGHFGQVVSDMEKWPDYGVNIIQIELGPSRVFPSEGRTDEAPVRELSRVLDRAQKSGVAVCLLISPHYMPGWALEKWPQLRVHREGFLQYCLHAREGRELLQQFVRAALAPIKDHPALHSICLSNEPVNEEEPCEPGRQRWRTWLEKRHGTIARLNALCGSNFAAFAAVPLPNPFGPRPAPALWMDYIRFNQEFFADWHRMLADAVHEVAPRLPVHTKAMTWTLINNGDIKYGVDATLFARFSDINGNDSVNFYDFGDGEFAQGWQLNAMGHDLQRSVLDAPVFNTENHLIEDRDTRYVPAAHVRAALWQAAVHGQSATAIWVWERTFDPKSDFAGSIMHRPACAEAVGIVNYDLNRAALEVTALQQAPAQALVLQSMTASVWDGGGYSDCLRKLYAALSFTGLKLGFVTERQLETGFVPQAQVVFVPGVVHLSGAALAALRQFKGRVVLVGGDDVLTRDEYGRERRPELATVDKLPFRHGSTSSRNLHEQVLAKLPAWDLHPTLELREAGQQPAWGVEWRSTEMAQGTVVNLCSYRREPVTVVLVRGGQPTAAQEVLTGRPVDGPLVLAPLEVRLLKLR